MNKPKHDPVLCEKIIRRHLEEGQTIKAIIMSIYDWYNHRRPHSYNGGLTPFEARYSD